MEGQMSIIDCFGKDIGGIPLQEYKRVCLGDQVLYTGDDNDKRTSYTAVITKICSDGMLYGKVDGFEKEQPIPYDSIDFISHKEIYKHADNKSANIKENEEEYEYE